MCDDSFSSLRVTSVTWNTCDNLHQQISSLVKWDRQPKLKLYQLLWSRQREGVKRAANKYSCFRCYGYHTIYFCRGATNEELSSSESKQWFQGKKWGIAFSVWFRKNDDGPIPEIDLRIAWGLPFHHILASIKCLVDFSDQAIRAYIWLNLFSSSKRLNVIQLLT